ncbi:14-3-3-like protein GF14 nu [Zea mays]|uniref:14-3-3-like protein GF14 nu n=1 Tax=Zea mays TaxID=4577 RepID=A0A1D6KPD9_MAIZE|nr:14-3-3-like protein GF14 nu [Zea mays]
MVLMRAKKPRKVRLVTDSNLGRAHIVRAHCFRCSMLSKLKLCRAIIVADFLFPHFFFYISRLVVFELVPHCFVLPLVGIKSVWTGIIHWI